MNEIVNVVKNYIMYQLTHTNYYLGNECVYL